MKAWRKILCFIGIHEWRGDGDNFMGEASGRITTICWWECQRCYKPKLKLLTKE